MRKYMKKRVRRRIAAVTMAVVLGLGVSYTGYPAYETVAAEGSTKLTIYKVEATILTDYNSLGERVYVGTDLQQTATALNADNTVIPSSDLEEPIYYYKPESADDSEYTTTVPDTEGTFWFKATIPEGEKYSEASSTPATFTISYYPWDNCAYSDGSYLEIHDTVSGSDGGVFAKNSITIWPNTGFLVKSENSEDYKESLTLSEDDLYADGRFDGSLQVRLRRESDGAMTKYLPVKDVTVGLDQIVFDNEPPAFSSVLLDGNSGTIETVDGTVVRAKKLEFTITDPNLSYVEIAEGSSTYDDYTLSNGGITQENGVNSFHTVLEAVPGTEKEYKILAFDQAGGELVRHFYLAYDKDNPTLTMVLPDVKVGQSYDPEIRTNSDGADNVKILYKPKGGGSEEYAQDKPTAAGEYEVLAYLPETDLYWGNSVEQEFAITRYTPEQAEIAVPDTLIGNDYDPVLTTDSDGKASAVITYKAEDDPDSAYTDEKPMAAGTYTVRAQIPQTDKYESISCTGTFKIKLKTSGENKVEIPNVYVGTEYEPVLTTDSDGRKQVQYTYRKEGEPDSAATSVKPTQPGSYIVRAVVPATANYEEVVCEGSFLIKRHAISGAAVYVPNTYVGETYEPSLTTDSDGKDIAVFSYKGEGEADTEYRESKPETPGAYVVRAVVPATDQYEGATCYSSFRILRHTPGEAKVEVADTLAGTDYEPVVTTDSDGADRAEFLYKAEEESEKAYSTEKPVRAGTYSVRAVIPETNKYEAVSCESTFRITLRQPQTAVVTVADVTEGTAPQPVLTTDSDGKEQASYVYKAQGQPDSAYAETVPTQAGSYVVKAVVPETDIYESISCEGAFQIVKAEEAGTTEQAATESGTTEHPGNTTEQPGNTTEQPGNTTEQPGNTTEQPGNTTEQPGNTTEQPGNTTEQPGNTTEQPGNTTEHPGNTTEQPGNTTEQPGNTTEQPGNTTEQPGNTTEQPGNTTEQPGNTTEQPGGSGGRTTEQPGSTGGDPAGTEKKTPSAAVKVPDIYVGTDYEPSVKTDSDGTAVIQYKQKGEPDSSYAQEKPVKAGTYVVRAQIPETARFQAASCTDQFVIKKYTPEGKVAAADIFVGTEPAPVLTTDSDGKTDAVFSYKKKGQADSAYTEKAPVKAGNYEVRADVPETEKYLAGSFTAEFKIKKHKASLSVQLSDKYVGTKYEPEIRTDSDAADEVVFEYKQAEEPDTAYAKKKPEKEGSYQVRAVLPETDAYEADTVEREFQIRYLAAPDRAYTLQAKEGKNAYYTSAVYLRAPEGYLISRDKDGEFAEQIRYETGLARFYLKRISDGALTDAVSFDREVQIDETAPAPAHVKAQDGRSVSIEDGADVFAESLTIRIEDENLAYVRINGVETEMSENAADFVFNADNGYKVIEVEAEDIAGNVWTRRFTLLSEWMKTNIVPANRKLPLETEKAYRFDSGAWQVNEDVTVYGGGQSFYVSETGDYTFQNK